MVVVAVVEDETGAALVQPPKSSSAVTVGAGFDAVLGAPQPAPTSFAVRVAGTCIMEVAGSAGPGAGSGVFHAFVSKGSMPAESMLGGTAEVVVAGGSTLGAGGAGDVRLNADFISSWGEGTAGFGGDACLGGDAGFGRDADDSGGGDDKPSRSFAKEDGLCCAGLVVGDAKFVKSWSKPLEEIDAVRA